MIGIIFFMFAYLFFRVFLTGASRMYIRFFNRDLIL